MLHSWLAIDNTPIINIKEAIPLLFEIHLDFKLPEELYNFFQQDITLENYQLILKTIESLISFCFVHQKNRRVLYIFHVFVLNSIKIAVLSKVNRGKSEIEDAGMFKNIILNIYNLIIY